MLVGMLVLRVLQEHARSEPHVLARCAAAERVRGARAGGLAVVQGDRVRLARIAEHLELRDFHDGSLRR